MEKNETEAVRYYKLSADQGNVDAQFNLAVCYATGSGVDKNETEALKYYQLAADQGNDRAILLCRYYKGDGNEK